jgi:hypothetical protein
MQRYKEKFDSARFRTIYGYSWLKIVANQEKVGSQLGISEAYVKHLKMFDEYVELQRSGKKTTFIISHLSDKYHVSESTVKRVARKLLREVTL